MENQVCALRRRYHVTRAQLAAVLGVDYTTVWRWENQHVALPRKKVQEIADFFEVAPCDVVPSLGQEAATAVMLHRP